MEQQHHLTVASSNMMTTIQMRMQFRIKSLRYFLIAFYILCLHCNIIVAYPQTNIHHQMSIEDLKNVFQVDSHSSVPEYEIVHVRSLHKREATNNNENITKEVHISAFGQDFRLRLQRNDHLSKSADKLKVYVAEMHTDGNLNLTEVTFPGNTSDIGEVYQDDASGAAVVLHHDEDGTILLDGTIGSNLAIKPAPASVRDEYQQQQQQQHPQNLMSTTVPDDEIFMDNELPFKWNPQKTHKDNEDVTRKINKHPAAVTTSATKGIHIVYQRKPQDSSTFSDYMFMEPDRMPVDLHRRHRSSRQVRETPQAVWPEILVIVDYDTYNMHGGNNMDIKRYFISFWNGVDLRYKLLGGPKVRISLAGIIISKGRDATPYLENNRVGGNAVDSAGALTELGKYLYRERRLPTYDVAVVVTKLDLCRREFTVGSCNKGTAGFAYVGGACVVNKRLEKVNSVAIIEDTGGFSGIIVAAHEVGHLLGAVHDGSPPPSYLGGPGAEHCRWEDGYIMSDLRHTERGFKWSICSTQQFKHFLNGETAKCLYNIPHEEDELPRLLPGKLLSLDAQCRKDRGTSACFKDDRVCAQLFCFDSRSGYCVSYRPAAEGSPCGDGLYCINGRCVPENENVIPDYSRVSEIVVPKPVDVTFDEENEETGEIDQNADLARIITPPRRTATLDNDDDVSIVSRVDDKVELSKSTSRPQHDVPFKRTSVLDNEENESLQQNDEHLLLDAHQPLNDHDESVALPPSSVEEFQSNREVVDEEGSLAYKRPSRLDDGDPSQQHNYKTVNHSIEPEVPHMRRTSHLDEFDELSFSEEEVTTLRNNPNSVTKTGHQVEESLDKEVECDDVMRELAGGLTCKQFLRRFGDRYCNHHYIMANCCSSRKAICEV